MVGRGHLRELFRFGSVRFVTTHTQHGCVELCGLHGAGIIHMFREGPVASFAVNARMTAGLLFLQDVGVTVCASLMAGEVHGASGHLDDGISAVVPVLTEASGNKRRTRSQKHQATHSENRGQSKKVPGVLEGAHKGCAF